ncbi:LexA family protein [Paenisporosarcina cavernae]|uniref:Helix-turn-helix domain-containing protein n=1 Tax=Paenisporosarcina cavernae TaxID=2320858 RepID=A0A385YT93_9BACL|nr:XRE family transcriptional regulator [Paenisporosarcina cavernae]AYC30039.1 helix-turn-helix domain-containing protein [Paenisporosarcina cavernae]
MAFKTVLKKLRLGAGYSMEELAEELNKRYDLKINKSTISRWEKGAEPKGRDLQYLAHFFSVSPSELMSLELNGATASVPNTMLPIAGFAAAGTPILAEENIIGYAPAPPITHGIQNRTMFYLKIKGDSMDQEFNDGSLVLVDKDADVKSGNIAVVLVDHEEATVKRIVIEGNYITLIPLSKNIEHLPKTYDMTKTPIEISGKVIGAFKNYDY